MTHALGAYQHLFSLRSFRWFWAGYSLSGIGDAMTRVALTWYVWETTRSPQALGLLAFLYTAPVVAGGLLAGWLLDRFDRRRVMMADSLLRGAAVAAIPLLHHLGRLELWHVYAVAACYGALMMVSLAGGPALLPSLAPREHLAAANALETLSFTLSGVAGPPLAGWLLARIGAPNVALFDAATYVLFALALTRVRLAPAARHAPQAAGWAGGTGQPGAGLAEALRLLLRQPVLLSTTLMFMVYNLGFGAAFVWLPIYAEQRLAGGAAAYGGLLACMAAGQVISALAAGSWRPRRPLGSLICLAQALAGAALALLLWPRANLAVASLALFGAFSAPLTIWAQTLRMRIIPEALRGRTFALVRLLMQSSNPLGGLAAGWALPWLGLPALVAFSALAVGVPGLLGLRAASLHQPALSEAATPG